MLALYLFVKGGEARAQFLAAVSQGHTAVATSKRPELGEWVCLTAHLAEQPFVIHLFDDRVLRQGRVPNDIMFEGGYGFIVIDDKSAEAQQSLQIIRAYAPEPFIIIDPNTFDVTSTVATREAVAKLLQEIFIDLEDEELANLIRKA
jgi:hypothetical protein